MAKWVELVARFDYRIPGKRAVKSFPVGVFYMTDDQAREALRLGRGHEVGKPNGAKVDKRGNVINGNT